MKKGAVMQELYEMRLRAFCRGLEMENIDKLMTGTVADFHRIGQVMSERIKEKCRNPQEGENPGKIINSLCESCTKPDCDINFHDWEVVVSECSKWGNK